MNQQISIKLIFFFLLFSVTGFSQNLLINELMSSNSDVVYDEYGETPDWIEIINNGSTSVNLGDYFLSDDKNNLQKWQFPNYTLEPGKPFVVLASGTDNGQNLVQWNSIIDLGHTWKYIVPTAEPQSNWKTYSFSETGWLSGASGIGYGDGDDNTVIASNKISVFMRKKFTISEIEKIQAMWLHMDYDDGFVAYLNGTEICRSGLGAAGSAVVWNQRAADHEANIYRGLDPEGFNISSFIGLLKPVENVLAIQVHNIETVSSDFSAIPILTVGYSAQVNLNAPVSKYVKFYSHANFKLASDGESVCLTHKDGTINDTITYGFIPPGYSYGRNTSKTQWGYFQQPTPGAINSTAITTEVVKSNIQFSIDQMFLTSSVQLSLTGKADGEEIRYTLNADDPESTSKLYTGPISIKSNVVVRARAFKSGAVPGKVVSRTYIFDAKPTVPVVAITTDSMNLWDNETGIYVLGDSYTNEDPYFGANFWEDWEKPAEIEMTGVDGSRIFSTNCGIKIFGAWSRARPQKSLAVFFSREYGQSSIKDVQLFKSKPITTFKSFVLRNAGNDYDFTRYRDGFMTNLVKDMNTEIQAFEPVVLYLNGKYWGHINLREKINEDYLASNFGVDPDNIDILEAEGAVVEGNNEGYLGILDFINNNNLAIDANYEIVKNQIDLNNYIDYMLSMIYFDNRDWPGNNIKYWRERNEMGRWRWIMYDTDFGFGLYNQYAYTLNTIEFALEPNGPPWPNPSWATLFFRKMVVNTGFKNAFINRFADMLNTTFLPENVIAKIDSVSKLVEPEIPKHFERWSVPSVSNFNYYTQVMRNFANNRPQNVRSHITQQFTRAGIFDLSTSVSPANSGKINLNTIEVGPQNWSGKYFQNVPIKLTPKPLPGFKFKHWEVNGTVFGGEVLELNLNKATTCKAVFEKTEISTDGNWVVINEINYNSPVENNAGDWVELYNWGSIDLNLSGWLLKDGDNNHQFVIPDNTVLAVNSYLIICRNATDFAIVNPGVKSVIGNFDFGLSSTDDMVRLYNKTGVLVDSVSFGSVAPWPVEPNGGGATLELIYYSLDNSVAGSWKASLTDSGTPGHENSITVGNAEEIVLDDDSQLVVYPNPFSETTSIRIEGEISGNSRIEIYGIDGRLVLAEQLKNNEFIWKGENSSGRKMEPGIYICKVNNGKKLLTAKIILKD